MNNDDFNDKQTLAEIPQGSEKPISAIPKPPKILVDFEPGILTGYTLDERFLIIQDLSEGDSADKGGIGLIYLAEDMKLLGKKVVIKILQEKSAKNEDLARKFKHEKEALIRIDHPNIVKILDSGVLSDGNPYMVMEYIPGYSLRRVIMENKELSFDFCAHIIECVTSALSAAHSHKILHRDIKPENIMLTPMDDGFEHIRLIDFGIARVEDSRLAPETQVERGIGTVLYVAPEQLSGQIEQTTAVDIYACATVAFEMLTGKMPFAPHSGIEMYLLQMQGVKTKLRELRPEIPKQAESLILQALSFEPANRLQDVRLFGQSLANALRQTESTKQVDINKKDTNQIEINNDKFTEDNFVRNTNSAFNEETPDTSLNNSIITKIAEPIKIPIDSKSSDFINSDFSEENNKKQIPVFYWVLIPVGLLIFVSAVTFLGFVGWKTSESLSANKPVANTNSLSNSNIEKVSDLPDRELSYYLNVQKMRDGKPFEEPFRASGREIFENGYGFKMIFKSDTDGFLYLFNEGKDKEGKTDYYLLYPLSPKKESGQIKANQEIETGYNIFSGGKGTEIIWIIWTKQADETLELAKNSALEEKGGRVTNKEVSRQLNEILLQHNKDKNEIKKDSSNELTVINSGGDVIIHRLELEHK